LREVRLRRWQPIEGRPLHWGLTTELSIGAVVVTRPPHGFNLSLCIGIWKDDDCRNKRSG